ncbi:hypothetical protein [Prevotella intermedia]|jgi:hypothetical protein|uniref:Uncharacterized protein n=2 Tax=Prevotella intermedia TaxID=28131 RepID=A0A0H5B3H7_PREIN|nr:hypothetical protein [Prevotella intermedia]AFJ07916.1 hypothetical protein PIN17_0449 [Prevotella intermedia 17]KJJ86511.1 hypothetical protein M573_123032 [Prevotella intermedia ZT]SUB98327.1 Uncharacterised protein [Prevotella intermedia]BAR96696.1 hypothetical protein PI172_1968 [Prevotella intermedia]BAU18583.1 hypothetical protein PIOMA14_II_0078 [Prevotella intermedia]
MKSWGYSEWYKNYKVEKDERRNDENVENNNRKDDETMYNNFIGGEIWYT